MVRPDCYAVTSLSVTQASHAQLAAIIRGHWGIEDRLHWVRDLDFDEDRSQVRTASGPHIMASLRNLVIAILRLAGVTSIAAALRYHARRPSRPLRTITKCQPALLSSPGQKAPSAGAPLQLPRCHAATSASSMAPGSPLARSATTIMCLIYRAGTLKVSGNCRSKESR